MATICHDGVQWERLVAAELRLLLSPPADGVRKRGGAPSGRPTPFLTRGSSHLKNA
jgi:hypothetical protein